MLNEKITIQILKIAFSILGVVLLFVTFSFVSNTLSTISKSTKTTGEVIGLVGSDTKKSVIRFSTPDGGVYTLESSVSSNPPQHRVGDKVSVLYQTDNPGDAKLNSFLDLWFASIITGILAISFSGIGFGMLWYSFYRKKQIEKLQISGIILETTFQGVERNGAVTVNGKIPFQIISHYNDSATNKLYIFKSDNLWFDPSDYIKTKTIPVQVDPKNYKIYHMDISFLPKLG